MMYLVSLMLFALTTSTLALPTTIVSDSTVSTTMEPLLESTSQSSEKSTQKTEAANPNNTTSDSTSRTISGVQIATDVLLLLPQSAVEEKVGYEDRFVRPRSLILRSKSRSLDNPDEYDDDAEEREVLGDGEDMDVAEAIVFRPLYRYRKNNIMRRRIYRNNRPYRETPIRRCSPCPNPYY